MFICLTVESLLMWIVTFRLRHCWSSSGDEIDCLHVTICGMLVCCCWCISILTSIPVIRWCSLIEPHNVLYTYNLLQNSTFKIYYEGTPPNNCNDSEDRNAPIAAYRCAADGDA